MTDGADRAIRTVLTFVIFGRACLRAQIKEARAAQAAAEAKLALLSRAAQAALGRDADAGADAAELAAALERQGA